MNDLIINGIDHGKFDIEWAKRGGVVVIFDENTQKNDCFKLVNWNNEYFTLVSATTPLIVCHIDFIDAVLMRMATPSECAEAGIEYIEPPARWLPIESAPKDGRRILIKEYGTVSVAGWGYVVDDIYGWVIVNDCYIEHSDNLLWMEHPKDK